MSDFKINPKTQERLNLFRAMKWRADTAIEASYALDWFCGMTPGDDLPSEMGRNAHTIWLEAHADEHLEDSSPRMAASEYVQRALNEMAAAIFKRAEELAKTDVEAAE